MQPIPSKCADTVTEGAEMRTVSSFTQTAVTKSKGSGWKVDQIADVKLGGGDILLLSYVVILTSKVWQKITHVEKRPQHLYTYTYIQRAANCSPVPHEECAK